MATKPYFNQGEFDYTHHITTPSPPLDFQTFLWPYVILCIGIQSFMKYINSSTLFFDALFLQETYLTFNVQQLINILLKHENENSTSETISIHLEPAGLAS